MQWVCKMDKATYVLNMLTVVGQSLADIVAMQVLPRVLLLLACSGLYVLFSWYSKSAVLPATGFALYLFNTIVFLNFTWYTFIQGYVLCVIIFVLYTARKDEDEEEDNPI